MSFDPRAYARQMASQYGLDPDIFVRMLFAESSFNPNAKTVVRGNDYVGYGALGAAAAEWRPVGECQRPAREAPEARQAARAIAAAVVPGRKLRLKAEQKPRCANRSK